MNIYYILVVDLGNVLMTSIKTEIESAENEFTEIIMACYCFFRSNGVPEHQARKILQNKFLKVLDCSESIFEGYRKSYRKNDKE